MLPGKDGDGQVAHHKRVCDGVHFQKNFDEMEDRVEVLPVPDEVLKHRNVCHLEADGVVNGERVDVGAPLPALLVRGLPHDQIVSCRRQRLVAVRLSPLSRLGGLRVEEDESERLDDGVKEVLHVQLVLLARDEHLGTLQVGHLVDGPVLHRIRSNFLVLEDVEELHGLACVAMLGEQIRQLNHGIHVVGMMLGRML